MDIILKPINLTLLKSTSTIQITSNPIMIKGEKGDKGDKGDRGFSAYELALQNGYTGSEQDFIKKEIEWSSTNW